MSAPTPIEHGEVVGYALAVWPPGWAPGFVGNVFEVWETVEEARAERNQWRRRGADQDVRVVEIREVVVE